jgi:hypothetical protein
MREAYLEGKLVAEAPGPLPERWTTMPDGSSRKCNSAFWRILAREVSFVLLWTSYSDSGMIAGLNRLTLPPSPLLRRTRNMKRSSAFAKATARLAAVRSSTYNTERDSGQAVQLSARRLRGPEIRCQHGGKRSARPTMAARGGERNVPYYQTNPPFFGGIFDTTTYEQAC